MFTAYKETLAPITQEDSKSKGVNVTTFINNKVKEFTILLKDNVEESSFEMLSLNRLISTYNVGSIGSDVLGLSMRYVQIYPTEPVIKLSLKELCNVLMKALDDIKAITYSNMANCKEQLKLESYTKFIDIWQKTQSIRDSL